MAQTQLDGLCYQTALPERDVQWSQEGVSAAFKFIQKLWKLNNEISKKKDSNQNLKILFYKKL